MHKILENLLKKKGIENIENLRGDEKDTFDKWNRILSEGEMTLEKIVSFCDAQLNLIDDKFKNLDNTSDKNDRLIIYRTVYKTIKDAIVRPQAERENLEKYLSSLLN